MAYSAEAASQVRAPTAIDEIVKRIKDQTNRVVSLQHGVRHVGNQIGLSMPPSNPPPPANVASIGSSSVFSHLNDLDEQITVLECLFRTIEHSER